MSNNDQKPAENGKRRNVYIYDQDWARLTKLGHGNVSAGIRALLERDKEVSK